MNIDFQKIENALLELNFEKSLVLNCISNVKFWLNDPNLQIYKPQIEYLIENEKYAEIFEGFYQIIDFGTGGRRGRVGVGPNKINNYSIATSAQGHSQFLLKKYGDIAKKKGIVIAFDVRQFIDESVYSNAVPNPIWGMSSGDFANTAALVYAMNGFKVYIFEAPRATPQLSFAVRHLSAVAGVVISASHNPPEYNGIKIYDETGGMILAPMDQELSDEINKRVDLKTINWDAIDNKDKSKKVEILDHKLDDAYTATLMKLSTTKDRSAKILYSSLHGTGKYSVFPLLKSMGFDIEIEKESSIPSGEFETVPNHIANPEFPIVYKALEDPADKINADIIITSDPDADRFGMEAKDENGKWVFIDGNEIDILMTYYLINQAKNPENKIVLATVVVTKLLKRICDHYGVRCDNNLVPGFKFLGEAMNQLEKEGDIEKLLVAMEDTHGHLAGNYARDKDASVASIYLSEYASVLKSKGSNIVAELKRINLEFGYHLNHMEPIVYTHNYEMENVKQIMTNLRLKLEKMDSLQKTEVEVAGLEVLKYNDNWKTREILSATDKSAKNIVGVELKPNFGFDFTRILFRPSGTEPRLKIYIEIGVSEGIENLDIVKDNTRQELERIIAELKKEILL